MYGSDGCGEIVIGPQVLAGVAGHNFDTRVALRLVRVRQVVCATRRVPLFIMVLLGPQVLPVLLCVSLQVQCFLSVSQC